MISFRGWWWLSGLVAGGLGLTASYLAAGLLKVREAPVIAVSEGVVALSPGWLVDWGIATFGESDKTVLIGGVFIVLGLLFMFIGHQARRRWWLSVALFCALGVVGGVAVIAKPGVATVEWVPIVVGVLTWVLALAVLAEWLRRWELVTASHDEEQGGDPTHTRRGFLTAIGVMGAVAVVGGALGRFAASGRRAAEASRDLLRLDGVNKPPVPVGVSVGTEGLTPWQTAAEGFYLIDTALLKPTIEAGDWQLRIHGMVEKEIVLDLDDLMAREITEDWITLNCVSNPIGGDLIGNAWWSGVRLAGLLAEAGPLDGADAVLQTSDDGWTCGTPLAALVDERNAMLAVAMNGEPLLIEHGFPVRTIVPGLYGYVSACKWVVDMEVTRFDEITAYWTDKGWAEMGPVKMSSRIDLPGNGDSVEAGDLTCGGMAWSQHTGIDAVEVSLDSGPWVPTELGRVPNLDTWVQWRVTLPVTEGDHELKVRATDAEGLVQTSVIRDVLPDGATGWHTIEFSAS